MAACSPRSRSCREHGSADGRGAVPRRPPRRRARGDRPRRERQDPRLPQGQGAAARCWSPRVGKERLYTEAVESHIGGWFWNAAAAHARAPGRAARVRLRAARDTTTRTGSSPRRSRCRPKPELPDWTELEVGDVEPEVPEELVEQRARGAARRRSPSSSPVEGRGAQADDTVVVDLVSRRRRDAARLRRRARRRPPRRGDRAGRRRHERRRDEGDRLRARRRLDADRRR